MVSLIAKTIQIEHIRLERGDVLTIDSASYQITSVETLIWAELAIALAANAANIATIINTLRPEDDEMYHLERFGLDGDRVTVMIEYPRGDPRLTPHGNAVPIDEALAHFLDPMDIEIWVKPATEPQLRSNNLDAFAKTYDAWFFGTKYRTMPLKVQEAEVAVAAGARRLEISRYVAK